jgi:hypothetical protein
MRKVTNVGSGPATYNASVTGLTGIDVLVSPSSFTINPGQTQAFSVALTRTTAALSAYVGGQLTWSDGTHDVRIPLVVRPVVWRRRPGFRNGGPISYNVTFYTEPFSRRHAV